MSVRDDPPATRECVCGNLAFEPLQCELCLEENNGKPTTELCSDCRITCRTCGKVVCESHTTGTECSRCGFDPSDEHVLANESFPQDSTRLREQLRDAGRSHLL